MTICSMRTLCLALFAVSALGAVSASGASADAYTAESYPVTVTGARHPAFPADGVTTAAGSLSCPSVTYHATLSGPSTTLSLTPSFNLLDSCTWAGSLPAIVDANACSFLFHVGSGATTTGTMDIVCAAGKDITITANQNTASSLTTKCTVHIPPQSNLGGITYGNTGAGTTRESQVTINVSALAYSVTGGSGLGACASSGLQHNGSFKGTELLTAETDMGSTHVGLFLTESSV